MRQLLALVFLMIVLCAATWAQDVSHIYTTPELQRVGDRYRPNLIGMWEEDFLSRLTQDERFRAGDVNLNLPLGNRAGQPVDFYSDVPRRQVFLPVASLKFFDDLAVAFAYYDKKGCDLGTVFDYAAVLRFRPQDVGGSPLDILGVPRTATSNPYVDDVAQKILKSTVYFVAAHEYAHVMYRHKPYNQITAKQAQQQESEADAFALEVMRRIGVAPMALTFFFTLVSRLEPSPGDFASLADYESYLRQRATHPVSAQRILKIAEGIDAHIDDFARLQNDPQLWKKKLQGEATDLRQIAGTLDDRQMRLFLAQRGQTIAVSKLQTCSH